MRPDTPAYLWDAREAASRALLIVAEHSEQDYLADWIRQAAVERQIEIIGEALNRVRRSDEGVALCIPDLDMIVATRNVIVHQYDDVDHRRVWAMLKNDVPSLVGALDALLAEVDDSSAADGMRDG